MNHKNIIMYNLKLTEMLLFKKLTLLALIFISTINIQAQQNSVIIEGVLQDNSQIPVPYVSILIPAKYIGTTSTEEGQFYLALEKSNLQDTLVISSMGFKTHKIKVEDYLKQNIKTLVLEEDVYELEAVDLKNAKEYVYEALKQRKNTFVSDAHQLDLLYRRTCVEQNVSKFFIEQYMSMVYKGPKSYITRMQVNQSRKSADYQIVKRKQWNHAGVYMMELNPLNDYYTPLKKMDWKKIGDTSYDGEDVLILEGTKDNVDKVGKIVTTVLYIGFDTHNIYKVESSVGRCIYQYAKNSDGKLYLSYHQREYNGQEKISTLHQKALGLKTPHVSTAYRHEAIVMGITTDKKKFTAKGYEESDKEMAEIKLPYNPDFWSNLSLPPDTAFYKKIKTELESNFGVPIETQFKAVN